MLWCRTCLPTPVCRLYYARHWPDNATYKVSNTPPTTEWLLVTYNRKADNETLFNSVAYVVSCRTSRLIKYLLKFVLLLINQENNTKLKWIQFQVILKTWSPPGCQQLYTEVYKRISVIWRRTRARTQRKRFDDQYRRVIYSHSSIKTDASSTDNVNNIWRAVYTVHNTEGMWFLCGSYT